MRMEQGDQHEDTNMLRRGRNSRLLSVLNESIMSPSRPSTFLLLSALLSVCSCATILNGENQKIFLSFDSSVKRITVNGNQAFGSVLVRRSEKPLRILLHTEDKTYYYAIEPHSSLAYWMDIPFTYGIAMFFEHDSPKRWSYPKSSTFRIRDSLPERWDHEPIPKGNIMLHTALPHANWFALDRQNGRASSGFWGGELGVKYFFAENSNISFVAGAATDFFLPVPAAVDIEGPWVSTYTLYVDVRAMHQTDDFQFGAGISGTNMGWSIRQDTSGRFTGDAQSLLGFSSIASYRVGKDAAIGVLYHPYLLRLDGGISPTYQHHIALVWTIR
jgi:hypothetical protein